MTELRRLWQLENENQWLKKLVDDLSLDKEMLQEVLKQKFCGRLRSARRCTFYGSLPYSVRRGCGLRVADAEQLSTTGRAGVAIGR